jgi:small subunit ribosomal protein S16
MVAIRLSRSGAKNHPFYHIVVTDARLKRDGRSIERIGFFNPIATGGEVRLRICRARAEHWIRQGAKPSDRVARLLKEPAAEPENVAAPASATEESASAEAPATS